MGFTSFLMSASYRIKRPRKCAGGRIHTAGLCLASPRVAVRGAWKPSLGQAGQAGQGPRNVPGEAHRLSQVGLPAPWPSKSLLARSGTSYSPTSPYPALVTE